MTTQVEAGDQAADFWNPEPDATPTPVDPVDFWSPQDRFSRREEKPPQPSASAFDAWALADECEPAPQADHIDWAEHIALPWYDAAAGENPYRVNVDAPSAESLAVRRGRWLSQLLDLPEPRRRRAFADYFAELFYRFPARATFQTLSNLAINDVDADAVLEGCRFRLSFIDSTYLSRHRRGGSGYNAVAAPERMLSWTRAVRLAESAGCDPVEVIDDDWMQQWQNVHPDDPTYWAFIDFIELRLRAISLGYLTYYPTRTPDSSVRMKAFFGVSDPRSRTGNLILADRGYIGVLYPEDQIPHLIPRERHWNS